jgi:hypothetical protein
MNHVEFVKHATSKDKPYDSESVRKLLLHLAEALDRLEVATGNGSGTITAANLSHSR